METVEEEEVLEPVSPTGQYLSSSVLSLSIIAVLELEVPFDVSQTMSLVKNVFLPINARFSSIMVAGNNSVKHWKRVEVKLEDHVHVPNFPTGMPTKFYDQCIDDYLSQMAIKRLHPGQPLWEIHVLNCPTSDAAANLIFKLHHSLGDGFSLMGALLSCLQRADNPSLPLTFPSVQLRSAKKLDRNSSTVYRMCRGVPKFLCSAFNCVSDSCKSSCLVWDHNSPIRSGVCTAQVVPVSITTITFSIDVIKQIKAKLGVTINDVITGTIFLGTRLYMQETSDGSEQGRATSLVLLNTRMFGGYKSVQEMLKPDSKLPWGNHFAFLSVPIPKLTTTQNDPLQFVFKASQIIKKKRTSSFSLYLNAISLQLLSKFRGPKAASRYLYGTMRRKSMGITNVMGPLEQMALSNHPVRGFYFVVTGAPQSVTAAVISYTGRLRVALLVEKGFIDAEKLKSHIQDAFDMIRKAALENSSPN